MLKEFNIKTNLACDGAEAVIAARSFNYDVILMDVRMPEMDGLQATRLQRRRPRCRSSRSRPTPFRKIWRRVETRA